MRRVSDTRLLIDLMQSREVVLNVAASTLLAAVFLTGYQKLSHLVQGVDQSDGCLVPDGGQVVRSGM